MVHNPTEAWLTRSETKTTGRRTKGQRLETNEKYRDIEEQQDSKHGRQSQIGIEGTIWSPVQEILVHNLLIICSGIVHKLLINHSRPLDISSSIGCCWSIALGLLLRKVPLHQTLGMVLVHER